MLKSLVVIKSNTPNSTKTLNSISILSINKDNINDTNPLITNHTVVRPTVITSINIKNITIPNHIQAIQSTPRKCFNQLYKVASSRRFELPTYRLGGDCSILLSYEDTFILYQIAGAKSICVQV